MKEVYAKFNEQGKELEQQNRALTAMTEKFEEATKAAEESERFDFCRILVKVLFKIQFVYIFLKQTEYICLYISPKGLNGKTVAVVVMVALCNRADHYCLYISQCYPTCYTSCS